ncbi:glutamate-5-semialdehyde dehydrogenase [Paramagnetospirillum kuznetsovii]|uniref:Gamma-glutamyl phosphate reductase n=1 Tax=Paramagnetospirillum kuznetsovii TaxID=2053833 RepID=A0A364NXV2_9PROT|nr:glutamate-5-semialdehyde dehydrogenase [Paramagnetospirillum kuznetsovii]RAU21911.1 glutamate-5-semialdehyde dehydrogenase [Paramagnetospirillum kuznetsovii]
MSDLQTLMTELGKRARAAARQLALTPAFDKNKALRASAQAIRIDARLILEANAKDMAAGEAKGLSKALLDRLMLNPARVEAMAKGLEEIAALPDPVGRTLAEWTRPNGLAISRVAVPLGVVGIIYESRPNVTADAAGLCLKSGNAAILRGGSESFHSSSAIMTALVGGITACGLPKEAVQMVPTTDRAAVGVMLRLSDYIDVIVPRGGKSLVARVVEESRIPLFQHLEGICHTYVDGAADLEMAKQVVLNAKMRRTGVCGATETLLVDKACAKTHLKPLVAMLIDSGCEVRGDHLAQEADCRTLPATEADWSTEYLDSIIAVKVVDGVAAAVDHINTHGSHHTEAIVTEDAKAAETFLQGCDSAIVLWNASTQFADGGEFGMGAEIGISTGKLHARGPVGVEQLCTFKYVVKGSGQVRPG